MSFPQSARAYADMAHPEPWFVCDRCGFRYNRRYATWQYDWRGNQLQNLRILVCTVTCDDVPQEQQRPIIIGPDPVPVRDPRPGFAATQQGYTPVFTVLEIVDGDILPPPPDTTGQLYNDGGVLGVVLNAGWPFTSPAGPGCWSNGGVASVGPGSNPNPSAPPQVFGMVGSSGLLSAGGNDLPWESPPVGSGILWNPGGVLGGDIWIA